MALRKLPMTMQDWETRLNRFLAATDREVLQDAGKVTTEIARPHAESEFEKYRIVQDRLFESDFDRVVAETKRLGEGKPRKGGEETVTLARDHASAFTSPAPRHAVRAHVRGAARGWAMLPTRAIGAPGTDVGTRSASAPPSQVIVSGSVPRKPAPLLNALGFSLPSGQKRERRRRPERPRHALLHARVVLAERRRSRKRGRKGNGPEDRSLWASVYRSSPLVGDESETSPCAAYPANALGKPNWDRFILSH